MAADGGLCSMLIFSLIVTWTHLYLYLFVCVFGCFNDF